MKRSGRAIRQRAMWLPAGIFVLLVIVSSPARGIVLHPGAGEPNLVEWVDRPADLLVGRWGNNASCVAISPKHVLTTRHQGGGVGTSVEMGGTSYRVERIWNHPLVLDGEDYAVVDIRIARLEGAELGEYAELYRGKGETKNGGATVMGGWGVGRGESLSTLGRVYGYRWTDEGNTNLRWCTNRIDLVRSNVSSTGTNGSMNRYHDYVIADFDDPGTTVYEGATAGFDSGGGWFVKTGGVWQVAGITWAAERAESEEVWFRSEGNPVFPHADAMYALRVNSYAGWVDSVLDNECQDPAVEDFNSDCRVDIRDVAGFSQWWLFEGCSWWDDYCQGRDLNIDGWVDFADFGILMRNLGAVTD